MKTKFCIAAVALAGAVWLTGCSTPESRITKNPEVFARLSPQEQAMVKAGQVGVGMDMATVKLALGDPDRVSLKTTAAGQSQIWHYQQTVYSDGAYLYPGAYWGGSWHRRWGGAYWGPGPAPWMMTYPVSVYDRFRIEFGPNGRVTALQQETG